MSRYVPSVELVARRRARRDGGGRAPDLARRSGRPEARAALAADLYAAPGSAHVIGITGVPGSGKSTLVAQAGASDCAPAAARSASSRSTRRARIPAARSSATASACSDLALDPGRLHPLAWRRAARPAASRGRRSTPSTFSMSAGFDTVIIETVGVGQDEVEIARAVAHDGRRLRARPRRRDPGDQGRASSRSPTSTSCRNATGRDANRTIDRSQADARCSVRRWPRRRMARAGDRRPARYNGTGLRRTAGGARRVTAPPPRHELRPSRERRTIAAFPRCADRRDAAAASASRSPRDTARCAEARRQRSSPRDADPLFRWRAARSPTSLNGAQTMNDARSQIARGPAPARSPTGKRTKSPPFLKQAGRAQGAVLHHRRHPGQARLYRGRRRRHAARGHRPARPLSVHARPLPDHVPQPHTGRCARSPASAPARTPTSASSI